MPSLLAFTGPEKRPTDCSLHHIPDSHRTRPWAKRSTIPLLLLEAETNFGCALSQNVTLPANLMTV